MHILMLFYGTCISGKVEQIANSIKFDKFYYKANLYSGLTDHMA